MLLSVQFSRLGCAPHSHSTERNFARGGTRRNDLTIGRNCEAQDHRQFTRKERLAFSGPYVPQIEFHPLLFVVGAGVAVKAARDQVSSHRV